MGAALHGVDVVGVGEDVFGVGVGPLHGDLHFLILLYAFVVYYSRVYGGLVLVLELYVFLDAALVVVSFLLFLGAALVGERYLDAFVEEGHLPEPGFERVEAEDRLVEDLRIRLEPYVGAGLVAALPYYFYGRYGFASRVFLAVDLAVPHAFHGHVLGKRIYYRGAYAVQTAGDLVSAFSELAACVQDRHDDLQCGFMHLGVFVYRHAAAVVRYVYGIVFFYGYVDVLAIAGQSLVHGVVYDLVDQVVKAPAAGGTDVHAGTFSDRFQTLQDLYLFGIILSVFLGDIF